MIELAFVDNQLDGSEWQVIQYARYWRCDRMCFQLCRSERKEEDFVPFIFRPSTLI